MFANYLIGLREGLEAALVVSILVAYLVRSGRREALVPVWIGVGLAVAISLAFGALLTFSTQQMSFKAQEAFGGIMSIIAVAFVTWMIFWMRRAARGIKVQLHGRIDAAHTAGTAALVLTAFVAVAREGLETSLFIWAAVQSTGSGFSPVAGAALGLGTAVVLGMLFYAGTVRINLAKFFTWTGAALIVVAAGVFAYAIHDLQEAGLLPGLTNVAFDLTAQIPPDSWYGTLLKGMFNISAAPTWLELAAWLGYLIPVMILFFREPVVKPAAPPAKARVPVPVATTTASTAARTSTATGGAPPVAAPPRSTGT